MSVVNVDGKKEVSQNNNIIYVKKLVTVKVPLLKGFFNLCFTQAIILSSFLFIVLFCNKL